MTATTEPEGMELTREQRDAVECRDDDILLKAGAGSGKTSTTVERYMRLLDEVDPSELLVFTFTDKAATELREKVRARGAASGRKDFSMASAWVGTFHAICVRILQSYPLAAGVDPRFTVLDDINAETAKSAAFNRSLIEFATDEDRERTLGLFREDDLRDAVSRAYEELRSRGHIEPRLPEFEPTDPLPKLRHLQTLIQPTLADENVDDKNRIKVEALRDVFAERELASITLADVEPSWSDSKAVPLKEYCEACYAAIAALAAREPGDRVRRHLGELLKIYGRCYSDAKRQASMLDYEDLQLITVKMLRENQSIADAYHERFTEIMVDEFQDTNRLQLQLINLLRGDSTSTRLFTVGDEMQAIYGFRHADVGLFRERDDDDSITPLPLTANFRSQAPVIGAVNEIGKRIDVTAKAAHGKCSSGNRHEFVPLKVGIDSLPDESWAEMHLTVNKGWKQSNLGPIWPGIDDPEIGKKEDGHYEAEALSLAHRLRGLVDSGKFKQNQIVVLLRAKTRIELYRSALEQVGLAPYIVGGTGFWESREATDIRALLAVIANPLDDEALLTSLVSPACGLSTDAIWMLRKAVGRDEPLWTAMRMSSSGTYDPDGRSVWLSRLPEEDAARTREFTGIVNGLREAAPLVPLSATVADAVSVTGYDLASLARNPDATGLANVRRLVTLAHEYESSNGRDLREFLKWIDLSAALDSESPAASIDEESDVIRLMTIHKAKGLEFDVVCLPDLKRSGGGGFKGTLMLGKPDSPDRPDEFSVGMRLPNLAGSGYKLYDWDDLDATRKTDEADEELRLFHVALTRARKVLILSGLNNGKKPSGISESTSISDRILKAFEINPAEKTPDAVAIPAPERGMPLLPQPEESSMPVEFNEPTVATADRLAKTEPRQASAGAAVSGRPPLKRPERIHYPDVPLSFTAINEYIECPARFFAKRVLRLEEPDAYLPLDPEDTYPGGRDVATSFGSSVHDILESVAGKGWRSPGRDVINEALRLRGLDAGADGLGERAEAMVTGFLGTELATRLAAGETRVELPLLARINDVTIRGFADLVLLDDVRPLILDYKTNRLDGSTPPEKMASYELQRDLYALAVFRATEAASVQTAFVFLEEPAEPVLAEYSRAEAGQAESRLQAVISEITAGRFFGGPEAALQPCGDCWACSQLAPKILPAN